MPFIQQHDPILGTPGCTAEGAAALEAEPQRYRHAVFVRIYPEKNSFVVDSEERVVDEGGQEVSPRCTDENVGGIVTLGFNPAPGGERRHRWV